MEIWLQGVVAGACWLLASDKATKQLAEMAGSHAGTSWLLTSVAPLVRTDPMLSVLVTASVLGTLLALLK